MESSLRPEVGIVTNFRHTSILVREGMTFGERAADSVAKVVGSWKFIICQSGLLVLWAIVNSTIAHPWDPYPFILMNLMLSLQAAYTAPMIMMSANRQSAIDRAEAHDDFLTNLRSESGVRMVLHKLEEQDREIKELRELLEEQKARDLHFFGRFSN